MNNTKSFDELRQAADLYQGLEVHFEEFCRQAERLSEPTSSVNGVSVSRNGRALVLAFLDRRVQIILRFDRKAKSGVLHVEDWSAGIPQAIERVPFDVHGETTVPGGYTGGPMRLTLPADCAELAARFLNQALDYDPWAEDANDAA